MATLQHLVEFVLEMIMSELIHEEVLDERSPDEGSNILGSLCFLLDSVVFFNGSDHLFSNGSEQLLFLLLLELLCYFIPSDGDLLHLKYDYYKRLPLFSEYIVLRHHLVHLSEW